MKDYLTRLKETIDSLDEYKRALSNLYYLESSYVGTDRLEMIKKAKRVAANQANRFKRKKSWFKSSETADEQ